MQAAYCSVAAKFMDEQVQMILIKTVLHYILNKSLDLYLTKANGVEDSLCLVLFGCLNRASNTSPSQCSCCLSSTEWRKAWGMGFILEGTIA